MASIRCPRITCRSKSCVPVAQDKKYKAGKGLLGAAIGGVLLGPAGAIVGAGTGMNGKRKQGLLLEDADRAGMKKRFDEFEAFLEGQTTGITVYDEVMVRQLIKKITAFDDHLVFEFKSGIETEVQM